MTPISRRFWLQKSLLASSGIFLGTSMTANSMSSFIEAYGEEHPLLRLHWNENPYGPSPTTLDAMKEALSLSNQYPDDHIEKLGVELLKKKQTSIASLQKHASVMIAPGSTDILCLLGQQVGLQQGEILTAWPSFPTLTNFGEAFGASIKKMPLDIDQKLDLGRMLDAITEKTSLISICNPNNPSSTEVPHADLMEFCGKVPEKVLVCVDEAYIEYSQGGDEFSMLPLVSTLPNLIVIRTFSKAYGLAGMRIGYAVSQPHNLRLLRQAHPGQGFSIGVASVHGAMAALNDQEHLQFCLQKNEEGRQIMYQAFGKWEVAYSPSSTNFIYAKSDRFHSDMLARLKTQNILITQWPIMEDHIRISIGKPDEMHRFVEEAAQYVL
ncbi:MAG: histidinol-phosphate transaminase [Bacteroidota bacterium]